MGARQSMRSRTWSVDVVGQKRSLIYRALGAATVLAALSALQPAAAEAQARGTVQVYAQVVDPKVSYDGLQAARAAVAGGHEAVSTLAQVRVAYPSGEQRPRVVVTIDYSKN